MKKYILVAMLAFAFGAFCGVAFKGESHAEDPQYSFEQVREIAYAYQYIIDSCIDDDTFFDVVSEMEEWETIVSELGCPYDGYNGFWGSMVEPEFWNK